MHPAMLTVRALAKRLRVDEKTVYNWERRGELPQRVRVGGRRFFNVRHIQDWEAERFGRAAILSPERLAAA